MANPSSLFYIIFFTTNLNSPLNFSIKANFYILFTSSDILYLLKKLIKAFIGFPINTSIAKLSILYI